jgi:Rod binding domain-containing protein
MPIAPVAAAVPAAVPSRTRENPERIREAAGQFEALLVGQMMRSLRESGSGWLGSGESGAGDCATDFAEQQFAQALTAAGGLGLASLITDGLSRGS